MKKQALQREKERKAAELEQIRQRKAEEQLKLEAQERAKREQHELEQAMAEAKLAEESQKRAEIEAK